MYQKYSVRIIRILLTIITEVVYQDDFKYKVWRASIQNTKEYT